MCRRTVISEIMSRPAISRVESPLHIRSRTSHSRGGGAQPASRKVDADQADVAAGHLLDDGVGAFGLSGDGDSAGLERHSQPLPRRHVALAQHDSRSALALPCRNRRLSVGRVQMLTASSALPRPSLPHASNLRGGRARVSRAHDTGCVRLVTESSVRRSGTLLLHPSWSQFNHLPPELALHHPFEGEESDRGRCYVQWTVLRKGVSGVRVLIADDHRLMVDGTKRALEEAGGFEVVGEASNGAQVLPLVKRLKPDLVLLDLRMPQMDGLTCLTKLKEQHPDVKVAILSVSQDPDVIQTVLNRGANAYIVKTVNPVDLPAAL